MKLRNISSEWRTAIAAGPGAGLELPYEKGFFSRIEALGASLYTGWFFDGSALKMTKC